MRIYRQGDVLLVAINEIPANATKLERENGKAVLAHGEATGHHHAISAPEAELSAVATEGEQIITADQAAELYLLVHGTDPVDLTHQEHATISVEPGAYRVVRQREYAPDEIRRVID